MFIPQINFEFVINHAKATPRDRHDVPITKELTFGSGIVGTRGGGGFCGFFLYKYFSTIYSNLIHYKILSSTYTILKLLSYFYYVLSF